MAGMTNRIRLLVITAAALGVLGSPTAAFAQTKLIANVGLNDAPSISLTNEAGATVRDIPAGTYEIEVRDHSGLHNFHLTGPGVDMSTEVGLVETKTWTVTVQDKQTYRFVCDPHATAMRGSFTVGGGPPQSPPPPPPPKIQTLTATVGPGFTISLRTASGRRVTSLKAKRYRIVVRDRSTFHNFHLTGAGVNKRTAVNFRGTRTWMVTLRKGKQYRYVCDPHRAQMKGSFRVT
jgi:plastocyanin